MDSNVSFKFTDKNVLLLQNAGCKASATHWSLLNYMLKPCSQCAGISETRTLGKLHVDEDMWDPQDGISISQKKAKFSLPFSSFLSALWEYNEKLPSDSLTWPVTRFLTTSATKSAITWIIDILASKTLRNNSITTLSHV